MESGEAAANDLLQVVILFLFISCTEPLHFSFWWESVWNIEIIPKCTAFIRCVLEVLLCI